MHVLVTDGDNRIALAVVRALAVAGHAVTSIEQRGISGGRVPICFASRAVPSARWMAAFPPEAPSLADLLEASRGADVILPVSINLVDLVARNAARFRDLGVAAPPPLLADLERVVDKERLLATARQAGLRVPRTWIPAEPGEARDVLREGSPPWVVKLRCDLGLYLPPADRYAVVRREEDLEPTIRRFHALCPRPLVQEYVSGEAWGASYLCVGGGRVCRSLVHRRIRQHPVGGGPSSYCATATAPELERQARKLLEVLDWRGLAMVEFRWPSTGRPVLMEINPRFWGSLPLAVEAGVNFPAALALLAAGEDPGPDLGFRPGVRLRFLFLDALAAWQEALQSPQPATSLLRWAGELLRGDADGLYRGDDPRPAWVYAMGRAAR